MPYRHGASHSLSLDASQPWERCQPIHDLPHRTCCFCKLAIPQWTCRAGQAIILRAAIIDGQTPEEGE